MSKGINRKDFLKVAMYALILPLLFILNRMVKDHKRFGLANRELRLNNDIPAGLSISDEVIFHKENDKLKVYSSRCTHLGCKINQIEGDEIVCPCHGSRYDAKGNPTKGPSIKKLKELEFSFENEEIVIQL